MTSEDKEPSPVFSLERNSKNYYYSLYEEGTVK